jgi:hypothetical protein
MQRIPWISMRLLWLSAWTFGLCIAIGDVGAVPARVARQDDIQVMGRTTLPDERIACQRIAIGEPDDYKPCIARLPDGELLISAFHQYKKEGDKVFEQDLLFRSGDGGRTWDGPENLDLLGREPCLTVLSDGTLVTSYSYRGAHDNVGVLPQLATGSLHTLLGEMRQHHWAGFYTRYWTVSDLDPAIGYLARASWDATITPEAAYADQVCRVCGPGAVVPALRAFGIIERITLGLDEHGLGFGFPVPGMMTKHYDAGGLSPELLADRQGHEVSGALESWFA